MAEFNSREEYEKWKAQRVDELRKKGAGDSTTEELDDTAGSAGDSTPPEEPVAEPAPPRRSRLSSVDAFFNRTWEIYKKRAGVLIALNLLSVLFLLICIGIFVGIGALAGLALPGAMQAFMIGGAVAGGIAGFIAMMWGLAAVVYAAVDRSSGVGASLRKAWGNLGSFIWLYSAASFLLFGGYLLFVAPGVIFLIWFAFGQFILAEGRARGMAALAMSREYVRDNWSEVFVRLFVVWLVSIGVGMIPFVGSILSILFMPFMTLFTLEVYKDLREMKDGKLAQTSSNEQWQWIGIAALGHVVLIILIAAIIALVMSSPCRALFDRSRNATRHETIIIPIQNLETGGSRPLISAADEACGRARSSY